MLSSFKNNQEATYDFLDRDRWAFIGRRVFAILLMLNSMQIAQ